MSAKVTKVGQSHLKLLLVQYLHWTYQASKYKMYLTSWTVAAAEI